MAGPFTQDTFAVDNVRIAGLQGRGRDAGSAIGGVDLIGQKPRNSGGAGFDFGRAIGQIGAASAPTPEAPRPPTPPSFEDIVGSLGGSESGGGSFGMSTNAGLGGLGEAQARAARSIGALEAQYESRKQELREEYKLTETEEERASIQHLLAVIEAQREAGTQVIERVYGQAIEGAAARAEETREQGVEAGARQAETFDQAAQQSAELFESMNERFGGAMGAASRPMSDVAQGAIANMAQQGQIERAFDERMFGVTADDIAFLGEAMRPEMGAQVGGLQRIAAQTSAAAQAQHNIEVNRRIAAERAQQQAAMQQLAGMFDQRRFGLEDTQIALMAQAAEMEAANARQAASLRASGANQLSPAQQYALRQAEMQHEMDLQNYQMEQERFRQSQALRGHGAPRSDVDLAVGLGLGQDYAASRLPLDALSQALGGVQMPN